MKLNYPICSNGFKTKTINIRTTGGGLRFLLQQINELGLPKNALSLGLWSRVQDSNIISSNNLPLVSTAVFNNAYISLKDRANCLNKIDMAASDYYLPKLTNKALFVQPIPSDLIDWNTSFIQINQRATALDSQVFELVVIYTDSLDISEIDTRLSFRTGLDLPGSRVASFEISVNSVQTLYPLIDGNNIGLDQDAIVLGFNLKQNGFPLNGKFAFDSDNLKSTYFTLKQGTNAFIDQFPADLNSYFQIVSDLDYFPIYPTDVLAIDWQQSNINIKKNNNIVNGMVFQFDLIWTSNNII